MLGFLPSEIDMQASSNDRSCQVRCWLQHHKFCNCTQAWKGLLNWSRHFAPPLPMHMTLQRKPIKHPCVLQRICGSN